MKVKLKHTYILEDCFDATERGTHVCIGRNRSTVIVEVSHKGIWFEREWTLAQLAERLAVREEGEGAPNRERKSPNIVLDRTPPK